MNGVVTPIDAQSSPAWSAPIPEPTHPAAFGADQNPQAIVPNGYRGVRTLSRAALYSIQPPMGQLPCAVSPPGAELRPKSAAYPNVILYFGKHRCCSTNLT